MKIHLLSLAILSFVLSACSKIVLNPRKHIEGEWKLRRVERSGIVGWRTIHTGYEEGVFNFARNGFATYVVGSDTLKGSWRLKTRWSRYRDEDGNDQEGNRQELDINLINFTTNQVLNLDFDDVIFRYNNDFTGVYQDWVHRYSYTFRRL